MSDGDAATSSGLAIEPVLPDGVGLGGRGAGGAEAGLASAARFSVSNLRHAAIAMLLVVALGSCRCSETVRTDPSGIPGSVNGYAPTIRAPTAPAPELSPLDTSGEAPLPHEPSNSNLLDHQFVFLVQVTAAHAGPWLAVDDLVQRREVELTLRLVQVWKGLIAQAPGTQIEAVIEQRRIPDPDGRPLDPWSRRQPELDVGAAFILFADHKSDVAVDAKVLLGEPALFVVHPSDLAGDVHLAKQGEKIYQDRLHAPLGKDAELDATRALLAFAFDHRAAAREVFGRYLWARIGFTFQRSPERPLAKVLALLMAPDTNPSLQQVCLSALAHTNRRDRAFVVEVGRAFVALLLDPTASKSSRPALITALARLVYPPPGDTAPLALSSDVVPDPAMRARARELSVEFTSYDARRVADWLGQ